MAGLLGAMAVALALAMPAAARQATPVAYAPPADLATLAGSIVSDGSANTGPITQAVAEDFSAIAPKVRISVDQAGTGGGFSRFCRGETDIQNASRLIKDEEIALCAESGVEFVELSVARDGITLGVNPTLPVDCLTTEQIRALWTLDSTIANFSELSPGFPDQDISLYGPAPDSGTFSFFVDEIMGKDGDLRGDYLPSQDYNTLVNGVVYDAGGIAVLGYAYYDQNRDALKALEVDAGDGCVAPTPETIRDGSYAPLSRPLYVYVSTASLARPEVREFMRFYVANAPALTAEIGFVPETDEIVREDAAELEAAIAGA